MGRIDDVAALAPGLDEPGPFQLLEMEGQGGGGHGQGCGQAAGIFAFGAGLDQAAEGGEPGFVGQGRKGGEGGSSIP